MKILIILAVVTLGKASEVLSTTSKYYETHTKEKPLSETSHLVQFNTHESLSPLQISNVNSEYTLVGTPDKYSTSSTIQGSSFKSEAPVSSHGLISTESTDTGTGLSHVIGIGSASSPPVTDNVSSNLDFSTVTVSSSDIHQTDYNAVPTTSFLTYTVPPSLHSLSPKTVNSIPVSKHDSLFTGGSKSVQIVSDGEDNKPTSIKGSSVNGQSLTVPSQSSFFNIPSTAQHYNLVNHPKLTINRELSSPHFVETTSKVPCKYSCNSQLPAASFVKYSTSPTYSASPLSTTTSKTYTVSYNKPLITNVHEVYPSTTPVHGLPSVIKSNPVTTNYVPNVFSKPYSTAAPSPLYTKVFSKNIVNTTPSFPIFTSTTPTPSPTPYSVTVTTPVSTNAFTKENVKSTTYSTYASTTPKLYSTSTPLPSSYITSTSTPNKYTTYTKVFSTSKPVVTNSVQLSSKPTVSSQTVNNFYKPIQTVTPVSSEKSSIVTKSTTFKPYTSLKSFSNPLYNQLSHASVSTIPPSIGISSTTYPNSNTVYHSSSSINSKSVSGQSSLPIEYSVFVPFRNVNFGVHDVTATGQQSRYPGNLPQGVKVTGQTVYSTPVPISIPSSTSKPELNPLLQHLSAQHSSGYNARPKSVYSALSSHETSSAHYDVRDPRTFAYSVQTAPLTKEYHIVETPVVRSWEPVGNWKVSAGPHFGKHFEK